MLDTTTSMTESHGIKYGPWLNLFELLSKLRVKSYRWFVYPSLTLNVQTKGYNMDPRAKNIMIAYRVYYKAMITSKNPKCLLASPKGKTLLFQSNEEHSSVMIPEVQP